MMVEGCVETISWTFHLKAMKKTFIPTLDFQKIMVFKTKNCDNGAKHDKERKTDTQRDSCIAKSQSSDSSQIEGH